MNREIRTIKRVQIEAAQDPNEILGEIIGPRFRAYRREWARAESRAWRPEFPLHLDIDLTHKCGLGCPMCPAGRPREAFPGFVPGQELPRALYDKVLAEGAREGLYSLRLGLTGEPLSHPDAAAWVAQARAAGLVDVSLITNGQQLTPERGRALIKAGLTRLMISVDAASEPVYRLVRPGGSWKTLNENIKGLARLKKELGVRLPLVRLSFVKMSVNAGTERDFKNHFNGLADYFSFQNYQNLWGGRATDFFPGPEPSPDLQGPCPEPRTRLAVLSDGGLFPCCSDFARLKPIGYLDKITLKEAWNSPAARALAAGSAAPPPAACERCRASGAPKKPALDRAGSNEPGA